jgi:hypothetical protein
MIYFRIVRNGDLFIVGSNEIHIYYLLFNC